MSETAATYGPPPSRRHRMHRNSLATYRGRHAEFRGRMAEILLEVVSGGPGTRREIMERMGFVDINKVSPRITDLIDAGELAATGEKRCPVTGERVDVIGLPPTSKYAASNAWRATVASAGPGLKPLVADQLNLGI